MHCGIKGSGAMLPFLIQIVLYRQRLEDCITFHSLIDAAKGHLGTGPWQIAIWDNSPESVEFLCTTLTTANPTIVEVALVGLSELTNPDLVHVLRQQVDLVPGTMRASIEDTIVRLAPRTR